MNFKEIDSINDMDEKRKAVNTSIKKANYKGDALSSGEPGKWSISDIVHQFDDSAGATMAAMHVHGKTSRGKYKGQSILNQIAVKLKVLTRQACYADKDGFRISKDPTTDEFVLFNELPVDGDVVRVEHGQKVLDPDTEKEYTLKELNYMKMSGQPTYEYTDYVVEGGYVVVNGEHAHQMLLTKGKRLVVPEYERAHSVFQKEPSKGKKMRITNWLFEEVADVVPAKPKRTRKPVVKDNDN